ncbi:MAG: hypothetical protein KIS94_13280 [Chitinophagales bacterium]|nr:hypothetical protein [Chitinophagales bacterium]
MIRIIAGVFLAIFAVTTFSSCKKCYECDFKNGVVRELCSKDFPDGTSGLKLTIDAYETQGYKCVEK